MSLREHLIAAAEEAFLFTEVNNAFATCPYLLQNGEEGAYGPNTCHAGCSQEPECVTGGPYAVEDPFAAIVDMVFDELRSGAPEGAFIVLGPDDSVGWLEQPRTAEIGGCASFGAPGEEMVYAKPVQGGGLISLYAIRGSSPDLLTWALHSAQWNMGAS